MAGLLVADVAESASPGAATQHRRKYCDHGAENKRFCLTFVPGCGFRILSGGEKGVN